MCSSMSPRWKVIRSGSIVSRVQPWKLSPSLKRTNRDSPLGLMMAICSSDEMMIPTTVTSSSGSALSIVTVPSAGGRRVGENSGRSRMAEKLSAGAMTKLGSAGRSGSGGAWPPATSTGTGAPS